MTDLDISDTLAPKSDQLDAVDLLSGPQTFTITKVDVRGGDQPVVIHLAEFDRPWKPNKNTRRVLANCWGGKSSAYVGRRVTLYCDTSVIFAGVEVGGVRISHMSDINGRTKTPVIVSQGKGGVWIVDPLPDAPKVDPLAPLLREMTDLFNRNGIAGKPERLAFCVNELGREVTAPSDMTEADVRQVIAALEVPTQDGAA